ncbi:MAG: DUF349 domain-containing protein, partial [Gammaproteobacteria bacterium]|nr:DUF349 domain-containing protein [Gammaproteobacteria bacterium]
MTVLSQFFSSLKAKPKTLEEQLAELDQLPVEALVAIAAENESDVFRRAAIARLDYGPALIGLAFDKAIASVQQGVQQNARQRLAELADQGAITLDQLTADGVDLMAQFAVVGFCQQDDLLEQLLDSNNDEDFLCQIVLEGVSIKSRQLAAEKIADEERLKLLLKETKGKDKQVYKIVKRKCDGIRDRDQHAAQTQAEIVSLCEHWEAHGKRPFDNFFTARHQHFQEQWALLQTQAHESIVARVRQATLECQQTIDAFMKQQADIEAREVAIANAAQQQAAIINKLRGLLAHLFDCVATEQEFESAEALLEECRQQWLAAVQYKPARKSDEKTFAQLGSGIEFQLQQLQQHGSLIDQLAAFSERQTETHAESETETETEAGTSASADKANVDTHISKASAYDDLRTRTTTANLLTVDLQPQQLLDARSLISEREKQAAEKKQAEKNQLRQLSALVRKAQSATDAGQSRPAAGIRRTIEEKRSALEPLPAYLSKQLEQLDAALEKLLDWKDYVVEPKQQQLIEQMRLLVGSQENPEALATKISRLQNEWKGLSKGVQDQNLWETFHQLAQQAYQPCKVFFDQQAKIRSDNLERRVQMVTQLENYLSAQRWNGEETEAEVVDSSAIEKLITTATKQWRSYTPVERAANKAVQQGFDRVLDSLRTKLNEHYQKNADIKRQLIDQVLQLVDRQDNRQAVEEVKRLQAQWKLAGAALR